MCNDQDRRRHNPTALIGGTPLVRINRLGQGLGAEILAKLEWLFVLPTLDGTSSGKQIEGGIKGNRAVEEFFSPEGITR